MRTTSIKEVARHAGVSTATVSRYMNAPEKVARKTRDKVAAAIEQLGYTPNVLAQQFRRGRTQMVMVVLPSVGDPFFTDVMAGIRESAAASGYSVVIHETQLNAIPADELTALLASRKTDGIILLASLPPFEPPARSDVNLPMVVGCEAVAPALARLPGVHIDNTKAAQEATQYLLAQGHRRIGLISGPTESLLTKDREGGFLKAMADEGIAVPAGWVKNGPLSIRVATQATTELMTLAQPPTAIFCLTDEVALGCLHQLQAMGKLVPQDISVMGFDDTRYAAIATPSLSTVHQPAFAIGQRVMSRLSEEIELGASHPSKPSVQEFIPHRLVIRDSVAPPKPDS